MAFTPVLFGTILGTFIVEVPFIIMLPYVPFELFAGGYIMIKGLSNKELEAQ